VEPAIYTPVSAAANLRRSVIVATVLGAVAIVLTAVAGHPLMGMFGAIGLAMGAINNRMLQLSVIRHASGSINKKMFRGRVAGRLGTCTLIAFGAALIIRPDGYGVFIGLAVFQVLMLVGAAVPVFRSLRPTS
jgi:hypothetical protein